jgi:chitinase
MAFLSGPIKTPNVYFFLFTITVIAGITAVTSCTSKHASKTDSSAPYQLIGYILGDQKMTVEPSDATYLTHINYAFANVKSNGKVVLEQEYDSTNLARLTALKDRNPNMKILLSIGGWSWSDHFSDAAFTEESRIRFAQSAFRLMTKYHLDGLDIDWEYPGQEGQDNVYRPADKKNFTLLLKTVRGYLDQQNKKSAQNDQYLLTIAAGSNDNYLDNTNLGEAHRYLDFVNLMTYDFHGSWTNHTGHHSNLFMPANPQRDESSAHTSVKRFIEAGIPSHKIVLGVPFYGRGWSGVDIKDNGLYQLYSESLNDFSFDTLANHLIDKKGFTRHWDNSAKAPYLWQPDSTIFISYEDKQSLRHKANYVKKYNLGGLMYWKHKHDSGRELLRALNSYLQDDPPSLNIFR